jgi:hypothetical protein
MDIVKKIKQIVHNAELPYQSFVSQGQIEGMMRNLILSRIRELEKNEKGAALEERRRKMA